MASSKANSTELETVKIAESKNRDEKSDQVNAEKAESNNVSTNNGNSVEKASVATDLVNKTTTTVTVNITQTKVVIDDAEKTKNIDQVVSSFGNIAADTVKSVDKIEQNKNALAHTNVEDVEMTEATDDVEMKDASVINEQKIVMATSSTGKTGTKTAEADSGTSDATITHNEAEQKIDDVEKNISNLFNGEENIVSTNTKSTVDKVNLTRNVTSQDEPLKMTKNDGGIIKDNHDLVSILSGNDKPDDKIAGSEAELKKSKAGASLTVDAKAAKSVENKFGLAKGVTSTPSRSTTQSSVFNSTPIRNQFEISSENVSTISESTLDAETGIANKSAKQEIISSHSSTVNEKSSDLSSTAVSGMYFPSFFRRYDHELYASLLMFGFFFDHL